MGSLWPAKRTIPVTEHHADGTITHTEFEMSDDLAKQLGEAQAEWKRLEEAGTPYWCSCDEPTDPYYKPDGYLREDGLRIQHKHGWMCRSCGGYVQEG